VRKRRWRYLDNTLSPRERAWVERHLSECVGCRAEFARAAFALESLQKGLPLEPNLMPRRARRLLLIIPLLIALLGTATAIWWMRIERPVPEPSASSMPPTEPPHPAPPPVSITPSTPPAVDEPSPPPQPKREEAKRPAQREPHAAQATPTRPTPTKRRAPAIKPTPRPKPTTPATPVPLPEGAIEVYDESGQLIKREQLGGKK
jgi:hypothetical protein